MFKPEYILDDVALFGWADTVGLIAAKFRRLGKSDHIATMMAMDLVDATINNTL